jgi:hypothetical protein
MRPPGWLRRTPAVLVADVLRRAAEVPADDYRRWQLLDDLNRADRAVVVVEAGRLLGSDRVDDRVLGAQMLDVHVVSHEPRGAEARAITSLLRAACDPGQDAGVIEAALGPYAMLEPADLGRPRALIRHRDPRVRRRAVWILATADRSAATELPRAGEKSDQDVIRDRLEHDPDQAVREEAGSGLESLYESEAEAGHHVSAIQISRYLSAFRADPAAGVRAAALAVTIDADDQARPSAVDSLLSELADPRADWRLVSLVSSLRVFLDPGQGDALRAALTRLQSDGWPAATGSPEQFPDAEDRAQMLETAIAHEHSQTPVT